MPDWQEILSRDGGAVWQTAYRYLGNRADADECFQEAFLAAFKFSRHHEVTNWRAILKRLAAARAIDRLRGAVTRPAAARRWTGRLCRIIRHRRISRPRMLSYPSACERPWLCCRRDKPRSFASTVSKVSATRR